MNPIRTAPPPVSLVLLSVDERPEGITDELLFDALLFRPERRIRIWRGPDHLAVMRSEDELDAVLWAQLVLERLRDLELRASAGVACVRDGREDLVSRAHASLQRARFYGGSMVLAWSTTAAVRDQQLALAERDLLKIA